MRIKIQKLPALLLSLFMFLSIMSAAGLSAEAAVKPELVRKSIRIVIGETAVIKVKNAPKGADITYKSKNKSVATVSKQGKVKGIKSGTAKIIVSVKKNSKITKLTCKVTVRSMAAGDGTVRQKPTNEVRWIDRVMLPDFALTLYETLEEAIDGDGYNDYLIDDEYFDLDGEDVPSSGKPGDFIRRSETRPDGSVFRHAGILVTTTVAAGADHDYISNCIKAVHTAFKRDHPEAFWLLGRWQVRFRENGTAYYCYAIISKDEGKSEAAFDMRRTDFRADGSSAIRKAMARRDRNIKKILCTIPAGADRYTQIYYLNDWLTEHNSYNVKEGGYTPWYATQCISALEGLTGIYGPVCGGYTSAFKGLCDALDIPCVFVHAREPFDPDHAWNYVQMEDGEWYAVDVTWNDRRNLPANRTRWLLVGGKAVIDGQEFLVGHPAENPSGYSGVASFTNGPVLSSGTYPESLHLSYMDMPKKLAPGDSVAMMPVLLCGADTAYLYSSTALPAGLELNPDTGRISGTILDAADALTVTVKAVNPFDPADCAECILEFPAVTNPKPLSVPLYHQRQGNAVPGLFDLSRTNQSVYCR